METNTDCANFTASKDNVLNEKQTNKNTIAVLIKENLLLTQK